MPSLFHRIRTKTLSAVKLFFSFSRQVRHSPGTPPRNLLFSFDLWNIASYQPTGCRDVVTALLARRRFEFAVERAVFLTVMHRLFAPGTVLDGKAITRIAKRLKLLGGASGGLPGPRLWLADHQSCDLVQTAAFTAEGGAHFLVRHHSKMVCCPDPTRAAQRGQDSQGRAFELEWGRTCRRYT